LLIEEGSSTYIYTKGLKGAIAFLYLYCYIKYSLYIVKYYSIDIILYIYYYNIRVYIRYTSIFS